MSSILYFHSDALRQRFVQHVDAACAANRIDTQEQHWLQGLEQPSAQTLVYSLTLDDGSPMPIGLATALLIVRQQDDHELLYLDTLSHGLERFSTRVQLAQYLRQRFGARPDLDPQFEYQILHGPIFTQRMRRVLDCQVQAVTRLADELDKLPSLDDAVAAVLKPRVERAWPTARVDLQAPAVQILETTRQASGVTAERVLRVQAPQDLALDALVAGQLPIGHSRQMLGDRGQPLSAVSDALFALRPDDLRSDYEQQLADYWNVADAHGLSRRDRTAQAIANAFLDQVWRWQAQHPADPASEVLVQLAGLPLTSMPVHMIRRLSLNVDGQPLLKLVSLYWIETTPGCHVLYSPFKGLRAVADWTALEALFNSPAGRLELQYYLSVDDQQLLAGSSAVVLHGYPLAGPLFIDCIDVIIAAQKRNLSEVLKRSSDDLARMRAMLDDALDVRALIDPRLPACQSAGRWSVQPAAFSARWSPHQQVQAAASDEQPLSWMQQVTVLDSLLGTLNGLRPGLQSLAGQALAPWLAVLGHGQQAPHAAVRWTANGADPQDNTLSALPAVASAASTERVQPLRDLLLERFSGLQASALAPDSQLLFSARGDAQAAGQADVGVDLLEHLLQQAAVRLGTLCARDVSHFYGRAQRSADQLWLAGPLLYDMQESLLRLELEIIRHVERFGPAPSAMLQQVLERPLRAQRLACGDELTEVQALRLSVDGRELALPLRSAWVMQQPARAAHGLLFWSALSGVEALKSQEGLQQWLERCLRQPEQRLRWLDLLDEEDGQWLDQQFAQAQAPTFTLALETIDGHFLQRMQQQDRQSQQAAVERQLQQARLTRMSSSTLVRHYDLAGSLEGRLVWLDCLASRIQNMLFATVLPDWLSSASDGDLELYSQLLVAYFRHGDPDQDFLAGIAPLRRFAHEQVAAALKRDFPEYPLQPQQITLSMTRYIAAPVPPGSIPSGVPAATLVSSENLVDFALNHFSRIQDGSLSVSLPAGSVTPARLTPQYLTSLVHGLDVGLRYQTLLASRFAPTNADYARRRQRFMRQIPSRMLLAALEMKLQGQLSQTAFDYLRCVLDMPDAKARQPVNGQDIVVRPLTLQPRQAMPADSVEGLFVIGPRDVSQGPLILHTLFNDWYSLREYRNQEDLLTHLRAEGPLQTLVLDRLDPLLRKRYDHGGLGEAHIPWSTEGFLDVPLGQPERVTLGSQEIEGNVLRHLFTATLQLLQHLSGKQSVTSAQADWASFVHVVTLGVEQVLTFVPGKIGFLVALWQSRSLLRESASAVSEQRWGKALSEFSAALGMLVVARREQGELSGERPRTNLPQFSWRHSALTQEAATRLRQFEVQDIELASLQYDQLYCLYWQAGNPQRYAAVAGKVYAVQQRDGVWRITGSAGDGPQIRLNQSQQWELNLQPGLRGGGQPPVHVEQALQLKAEQYMTIQARGMAGIRAFSRDQARLIGSARQRALSYLNTALLNLGAPFAKGLARPVRRLLKDFFGVNDPGLVLIDSLRQRITELYEGFAEPSLSVLDSDRFVVGLVKPGHEDLAAFVITNDPQRRIFLGDMFFTPPVHVLKTDARYKAFSADEHFRAMALLHEMSHVVSQTRDYAYLDASAPPTDLLDDSFPGSAGYKQGLQRLRDYALSHRTPAADLFRTRENNIWRDFNAGDGQEFHSLLRLSGEPTLAAARQAFLTDPHVRRRIILNNADSVAMLVALLGRERFAA